MRKGAITRGRIMSEAITSASRDGVGALTIGSLAHALSMSKSGLFAHFGSKDALQAAVVAETVERFASDVVKPALALPPGRAQVRQLLENWIAWSCDARHPGGCPMISAVFDLDTQPGEARDLLVAAMERWRSALIAAVDRAKKIDMPAKIDCEGLVMEIFGLYLAQHTYHWLLGEEHAGATALKAFDAALERACAAP
jgi:AcrR family transcriptional regulator